MRTLALWTAAYSLLQILQSGDNFGRYHVCDNVLEGIYS